MGQPIAWTGDALHGRHLLVKPQLRHPERISGFGDSIQDLHWTLWLAADERVTIEIQEPLVRLVKLTGTRATVLDYRLNGAADCDLWCSARDMRSLLFDNPMMMAPTPVPTAPYLYADVGETAVWHSRLPQGLRVGVCRHGSASGEALRRDVAADVLAPLADVPGIVWVSLQKDDSAPLPRCFDYTPFLYDFAATAALMNALDLVISTDTAVAHLAGALGKELWLMAKRPDFEKRWSFDGLPYYGNVRVFRQALPRDWGSVVNAVKLALRQRVSGS